MSEANSEHASPSEALLFIITCVVIGISTKYFLTGKLRVPVPYTALLLVFGLCIGLIQGAAPKTHAFTATLSQWMSIDPHLLLLIFLPTIGFSAALGQEPHLLRKNWGQILILAWPGVVVTFLLIAICAKYFFPYGWTWPQALLFGAMLSATDPVAVVAVLHEVGADEKLANVIDGESLVNDGSALVIFLVLQQFVQGATLSAGEIVVLFLRLALLGAAVGFCFALVTSAWLARIFNDAGLEIILTFGAAYSCYFVAEELLGASGLLAVVVMGFSMSLMGGRQITNRIKVEMHAFWEALEWLANTILFLWVGIALGLVLPPKPTHPDLQFEVEFSDFLYPVDAGYAVVLYLWLLVARSASVALFYPLLSTGRVGYAMTWKTAVVLVWAGLRGAVGVAMSLFILFDPLITSHEYKAHCVFYMAVMAFATVLINGSTTKYVLRGLGLLDMTPQQVQVLEHVLQEVDDIRLTKLQELRSSPVLGLADPAVVNAWTTIDARSTLANIQKKLRRQKALSETTMGARASATAAAADAAVAGIVWQQLVAEYRRRLLCVVKASYGELYQHFELGTSEVGVLQEVTDKAMDEATAAAEDAQLSASAGSATARATADPEKGVNSFGGLTDWEGLTAWLGSPGWADRLAGACGGCCGPVLKTPLQQQAAAKMIVVSAFVNAHTTAQQVVRTHLAELCNAPDSSDGTTTANARPPTVEHGGTASVTETQQPGDLEAAELVLRESEAEVAAALAYAKEVLLPCHPQLASLLMSRHAAVKVLEEQLGFLEGIEAAGLIKGEEVHGVNHIVNHRLEQLQHERHWHLPPSQAPTKKWQPLQHHDSTIPPQQQELQQEQQLQAKPETVPAGAADAAQGLSWFGDEVPSRMPASSAAFGSVANLNYTASLRRRLSRVSGL